MHIRTRDLVVSILPLLSPILPTADAGLTVQHGHEKLHLRSGRVRMLPRQIDPQPIKTTVIARSPVPDVTYPASGARPSSIVVPTIKSNDSQQHQTSYSPDMSYLPTTEPVANMWLPESMQSLTQAVDALSMAYPMDASTGSLTINNTNESKLKGLSCEPSISRDGGKGGYLDGHKLFIFADTSTSSSCAPDGGFAGFVSTSAAVDSGSAGLSGQGLSLRDGAGAWATNFGTMRGFIPLTVGESAFNNQNNASMRYAIWPDSSIIPFDGKTALLYAPIVFLDHEKMTYAGSTLSSIAVPGTGGPVATRIAPKLFMANEPEWGTIGGIRSYGASGPGNSDGLIYIFAKGDTGLLLARTQASTVADRNSYEYYQGGGPAGSFSSSMPSKSSTATFVQGSFTAADIFYSPRHMTFICVYQDAGFDSTIFWKYLKAPKPIIPKYAGGDEVDIVQNIYKYEWIDQGPLYEPAQPSGGRAYNGGMHAGYFDANDITNGGNKMLIAWIGPTAGGQMNSASAGYEHFTTTIEFN